MRLKKTYSSREVAAVTGLSARQLQWWDARKLLTSTVAAQRTAAGGFTERRYSPVELYELLVLADLRRHGFSVHKIRALLKTLKRQFGIRLYDAIRGGGEVTLLTMDVRYTRVLRRGSSTICCVRRVSLCWYLVKEKG